MCRGGRLISANVRGDVCIASVDTLFFLEADKSHLPQLPNSLALGKHPDIVVPVASCGATGVNNITKKAQTWVESYRASCAADEKAIGDALQHGEQQPNTGVGNSAMLTDKYDAAKPLLHLCMGTTGVIGALEGAPHDGWPFTGPKVLHLCVCVCVCE
jgi:hypothetical protein